jgi:uracil-DNA glycosylase
MAESRLRLEASWQAVLAEHFDLPHMRELRQFLVDQKQARREVYPPGDRIFAALDLCPLPQVKVVIVGQDPYHGPGQAHGLCFSVPPGVPQPPSLINIFKEINEDLGTSERRIGLERGCLEPWARQGVLLLNAVLTVERGRPASHQNRGWETFTDRVVEILSAECQHLVFLLWGSYAQKKGAGIDRSRHCVLTAPHPSPLSAHRGFFGCRHFSKTNDYLVAHGKAPSNWFDVA